MYFAEFDTDKFIRETFFPDFSYKGTMIEVGAGPPVFYSMSKHWRIFGWRCICVEPNPEFVRQHELENNEIYEYACSYEEKKGKFKIVESNQPIEIEGLAWSALEIRYGMPDHQVKEIDVNIIKLDSLLSKLQIVDIDILSIDTEGWEIEVLQGFNLKYYSPKIVLLENYEANQKYIDYMSSFEYRLVETCQYNYIFTKM